MTQDSSDPIDALRRLVDAVAKQRYPLDREDLHAVSGLRAGLEGAIGGCIDTLDATGRFTLLGALQEAMGESGGMEFTAVFVAGLRDDDLPVRSLSANGLAVCETAEATAALVATARSAEQDDGVRGEAVAALGEVALRVELGWAGSESADSVVATLRLLAEDVREELDLRAAAIAAAGVVHEDWVTTLIDDAYGSDDPSMRLGAIHAMGRNADGVWLPLLEAALFAEDVDERSAAATAIGEVGSEEGVPMLLDLLAEDLSEIDVMVAAIHALGEIGGAEAIGRLEELRTHPDAQVRDAAHDATEEAAMLSDGFAAGDSDVTPDSLLAEEDDW